MRTSAVHSKAIEFIPGRVYFLTLPTIPCDTSTEHYFSTDNTLVYWNFFLDFGPLNLGQTYRFCQMLGNKLNDPALKGKTIYYYCSNHPHRRTNSTFLLCAYGIMYLGLTPEQAYAPFSGISFPPFHDASPCACTYNLTIMDCLQGMYKARQLNFFNFDTFNVAEYEKYEKVEEGDFNWLVYGKFLAFAGPHNTKDSTSYGYTTLVPEDYVPYFKSNNVKHVIRLNKKYYDRTRFTNHGINHSDIYFLDGSTPSDAVLQKFILACESTDGAIAVHCKAGLGRTGTCIGAYIMKHYGMTAAEVIGWFRICRPGTIIGPQQQYMEEIQAKMWREGEIFRERAARSLGSSPSKAFDDLKIRSKSSYITAGPEEETSSATSSPLRVSTLKDVEMGDSQGDSLRMSKANSPFARR